MAFFAMRPGVLVLHIILTHPGEHSILTHWFLLEKLPVNGIISSINLANSF
jgi:hypothetical protein